MTIKILVNGAFGQMGQITTKAIEAHPKLELVGQTGREYDLATAIKDSHAQVVVDFTHPEVVFANTKTIMQAGARPVIGTTGLSREQILELQTLAKQLQLGGIVAPNFSLGAVLMIKAASQIAKYMSSVEIIEMHHPKKVDSPSGTALRSAEKIAEAMGDAKKKPQASRETVPGARGALHHQVPIHAVRLPGLLAHEQIIFGGEGETLSLRHDSLDRQCFMPGICLACEKVMTLKELIYGLEELI